MRMPQVSEKVKEAPAQALRGVFAGLGQLLLITDKLRNKTPVHAGAQQARTAEAPAAEAEGVTETAPAVEATSAAEAEPVAAAEPAVAEAGVTGGSEAQRDRDRTGNVRLLTEEAAAPETVEVIEVAEAPEAKVAGGTEAAAGPEGTEAAAGPEGTEAAAEPAEMAAVTEPAAAEAVVTEPAEVAAEVGVAPLPNYDELTVASLRARLRNLSVEQVRELAEYERAHAGRPEVVAMFERRVAKLEAGA